MPHVDVSMSQPYSAQIHLTLFRSKPLTSKRCTPKRYTWLTFAALLLFISGCTSSVPANRSLLSTPGVLPAVNAPLNLCEAAVTDQQARAMPPMQKPGYLQPFNDPAFGARIIRISNNRSGDVTKPLYNTIQAWNADESLMLLFHRRPDGSDYQLLDGRSYKPVDTLTFRAADVEEVFWSRHDPDRLFYVSSAPSSESKFYSFDVSTNQRSLIRDFSPQCRSGSVARGGGDVYMQSMDDDLFGFRCEAPNGGYHLMSYRISTDALNVVKAGEGNPWDEWRAPMPSPSGTAMWLQGDVIDPEFNAIRQQFDLVNPGEHGDIGLDHNRQDALFQTVFDPSPRGCNGSPDEGVGHLAMHHFSNGDCRAMVTESEGWPYTTSGTHVSAGAFRQPGWVTVSSIGYREQLRFHRNQEPATPLFSEIYMVNTRPAQAQVCRLAHHRSFGKFATNGGYPAYFGEPHPSQSPSGTRIVFGSDWQDSGAVDTYVIELPSYEVSN